MNPRTRRPLTEWAQTAYRLSQRAARLIPVRLETLRYRSTRNRQDALQQRLRELAAVRVRFGYARLTVLLKREDWPVNAKRIYRLYDDEGLTVRTKSRKRLASRRRVPMPAATRPNERGSMDFVSARLRDGRWFRALTVLDLYTRESLALVAKRISDRSEGRRYAESRAAGAAPRRRRSPLTTAASLSAAPWMDAWAYAHDVRLDFIRPGKPVENAFIESFKGKLRDECLNSHVFGSVTEAQQVLGAWRDDYNLVRPHSSLQDRTPAGVGAMWVEVRHVSRLQAMNRIELETTGRFVTISPS